MTLREKVAQAIDEAINKYRRNSVFHIEVADPRLTAVWPNSQVKKVYVLRQDDSLPQICNPMAFRGCWFYKQGWLKCRESYLDSIMECLA